MTSSDTTDPVADLERGRAAGTNHRRLAQVGHQRQAYTQFALTWEKATQLDREHDGEPRN